MQMLTRQRRHSWPAPHLRLNRFLQYPVMSTLRPAYPRGPWHYKNMHQLVVTYESTAEAVRAVVPPPLNPPTATASP